MPRIARTLPIASAGSRPEVHLGPDDWQRVEDAYGHKLPEELRAAILKATSAFVEGEVFEHTAEPARWTEDRIKQIKEGAAGFYKALLESPREHSDACFYANHLIKKNFTDPRFQTNDLMRTLARLLSSLLVACNRSLREISSPDLEGHREGDCWEQWVRRLTSAAKGHGLPTGARNDSDKNKGQPSAFVMLTSELQHCVPVGARRHVQSPEALAKAITRARKRLRDTKAAPSPEHKSRKAPAG